MIGSRRGQKLDLLRRRPWNQPGIRIPTPSLSVVTLLSVLLVFQFIIPSRYVISGMGAIGRPAVAVGLLLIFIWCASVIMPDGLPPQRQPVRWLIGAYCLLQLFGYGVANTRFLTEDMLSGANMWLLLTAAMAGVCLNAADGIRSFRELDRLMGVIVGLAAVMGIVGLLQFLEIVDLTRYMQLPGLVANADLIEIGARGTNDEFPRVAGTANHYIEFGVTLAMTLPPALHRALHAPGRGSAARRWLLVGIIGTGIPLSISRSAILVLGLALLVLGVGWTWRQRVTGLALLIGTILAFQLVMPRLLQAFIDLFLGASEDPSIKNRLSDAERVEFLFNQRPWFGLGGGTVLPQDYLLLDNQWYGTLLAGGILGVAGLTALLLIPTAMTLIIRRRSRDEETRHLAQVLAATFPSAGLASATFDSLSFATVTAYLFLSIGMVGALWRLVGSSPPGAPVMERPASTNSRVRPTRSGRCGPPSNFGEWARVGPIRTWLRR